MCLTFNGHQIKVTLVSSAWAWHMPRSEMKVQGPSRPRYSALRLTPLSTEFHNRERARFLLDLNKMPLLLQKAEINNYSQADQHQLLYNWAARHICIKKSSVGRWGLMGQPSRICQAFHNGRVPWRYPKKGNWKTAGVWPQQHHQVGGPLPMQGKPVEVSWVTDLCATPWQKQLLGLLYLKAEKHSLST